MHDNHTIFNKLKSLIEMNNKLTKENNTLKERIRKLVEQILKLKLVISVKTKNNTEK